MHNFSSLLNITLHVPDGLSVRHQEFKTVYTASGICHTGSVAACWQAATDRRKDRPEHLEWYLINSKNCASSWFYYRNISRCTVPWTSNSVIHSHSMPAAEHIQHQVLGTLYRQQRLYCTRSSPRGCMYRYQPRHSDCAVEVLELCPGRMRVGCILNGGTNFLLWCS